MSFGDTESLVSFINYLSNHVTYGMVKQEMLDYIWKRVSILEAVINRRTTKDKLHLYDEGGRNVSSADVMEKQTLRDDYWQGVGMLEAVIDGGTTKDNLHLHGEGGGKVCIAVELGIIYQQIPQTYVEKALNLLQQSYDEINKYTESTGDPSGSHYMRQLESRMVNLSKIK